MSAPPPELRKVPWWRRKWVTVGEVVGLGALAIAALGYFDAHRDRTHTQAERAAQKATDASREAKAESLVLIAEPAEEGARLLLRPVRAGQVVQSQRYVFPRAVLDHPMEVAAAQPQIQAAWLRDGLRRAAEDSAKVGERKAEGDGRVPVGVITTYVEDGEVRTDSAVYVVGYRVSPGGLLGGARVTLQGIAIAERGAKGDLQAAVDARWRAAPGLL